MQLWFGVDPGANETGLVLRRREEPEGWEVVTRDKNGPEHVYLLRVLGAIDRLLGGNSVVRMVIEDVKAPNPHLGMTNASGQIGTAKVFGAVMVTFLPQVVQPAGFGSGPPAAYPAELWGEREGPAGTGKLRHVRSAWDISIAGAKLR